MFQSDLLNNKVALITGGGTGICCGIALAFAASEAASYVNGVTLVVDGGLWLRSARILGE